MQERLQKILARGGVSSRRAAETLIREGRVRVNGKVVTELGTKADPVRDKVEVGAVRVQREDFVYYVLHKPRGVVSTLSDPENRPTIKDLLPRGAERLYPVGRLDFHTSGVLLLTNDGDFANGLLHPKMDVPKIYVVKVQGEMKERDLEQWRNGVNLEDGRTKPAKVTLIRYEAGKTWFEVIITEGRNQQVRRMGEATGFPVMRLARMEFAGIGAEGLAPGSCRMLTRDELKAMKRHFDVPRRISGDQPIRTEAIRPTRASGRMSKFDAAPARERDRDAQEPRAPRGPNTHGRDRERTERYERPSPRDEGRPMFDSRTPARETRGARPSRDGAPPRERAGARGRNKEHERSGGRSNQEGGRRNARAGSGGGANAGAEEFIRSTERAERPAAGFRRSHGERPPPGPAPSRRNNRDERPAPARSNRDERPAPRSRGDRDERPAPRSRGDRAFTPRASDEQEAPRARTRVEIPSRTRSPRDDGPTPSPRGGRPEKATGATGGRGWVARSQGPQAPRRSAGNKNKDREPKATEERAPRKSPASSGAKPGAGDKPATPTKKPVARPARKR